MNLNQLSLKTHLENYYYMVHEYEINNNVFQILKNLKINYSLTDDEVVIALSLLNMLLNKNSNHYIDIFISENDINQIYFYVESTIKLDNNDILFSNYNFEHNNNNNSKQSYYYFYESEIIERQYEKESEVENDNYLVRLINDYFINLEFLQIIREIFENENKSVVDKINFNFNMYKSLNSSFKNTNRFHNIQISIKEVWNQETSLENLIL